MPVELESDVRLSVPPPCRGDQRLVVCIFSEIELLSELLNFSLGDATTQHNDEVQAGLALVADVAFIYD
ncbi:hypothetical protein ALC60_13575 [Trachymyrmex zeteki]|uniref:Uncharacterized protein n=1 Tax=Mycetomoellerius zeteki TaxID=64791 RepID=A0A151WI10_9HYME|nr:hypothetical protein ALC60_13575 [Trachymyrmex zeteki]